MRTTIDIDDHLLVAAKQRAAAEGRTLRSLVEEALIARLTRHDAAADSLPLPVFTPSVAGTRPGVDLFDNAALRDLLGER